MNDSLATTSDVRAIGERLDVAMATVSREMAQVAKRFDDEDARWRQHLVDQNEQTAKETRRTMIRTGLYSAAIAALGVVIVGIIQVVSNHSFAAAREQMREVNRQDRLDNEPSQTAHDELLVKRVLDERDRRLDQLIVKGLQK
jgi:hypothetical protein